MFSQWGSPRRLALDPLPVAQQPLARLPPGRLTCEPPAGVPALVFSVFVLATLLGVHLCYSVPGFLQCHRPLSDKPLAVFQVTVSGHGATPRLRLWAMKAPRTFLKFSSKLEPPHFCTWAAKPGTGHSVTSSSGQRGGQTQASPRSCLLDLREPLGSNCELCVSVSQGTSSFLFFLKKVFIFLYDYECSTCTPVYTLHTCMYVHCVRAWWISRNWGYRWL